VRNPFIIDEPTVISFSGGRTSAYMLWRVLQANNGLPDEAIVCFANTGKEEEATLEFVRDCSVNWNVPIHWVEYRADDPKFAEVTFETASRNGEPFEQLILKKKYLPNPVARFCTSELKVLAIDRFLKSKGISEYVTAIGIRADEQRRAAKMVDKFIPLVRAGITQTDVQNFWRNNTFDLGLRFGNGITALGNCDLCFLKGQNQIMSLVSDKPDRAIWWAKMEEVVGATWRKDRPSYSEMHKYIGQQMDMLDESIDCFCGD
jgi:3'-phosphoadenosine 5'-phosphosulfate sulfotransferase (PAPS reductase)/FAD synthetase